MRSSPALRQPEHASRPLLRELSERWWLFVLRGVAAVVFGALAFAWPGVTLITLVLLYGIFALTDGLLAVGSAIRGTEYGSRWWLAIVGLLGIAAGMITLLWPGISGRVLLICIAVWAIATGIMQIVGAIWMRHEIDDEWLLITGGALSATFGFLLFTRPSAGALALVAVIAAYAIIYGIILIALGLRLRKSADPIRHQHGT